MIIHGAKPRSDPEVIKARMLELTAAFTMVAETMHKFDGTQMDSPFGTREMATAHTYLQTAWFWAKNAVEEN